MKLLIQIPCFNEEKTLPLVLKAIPKKIKGIQTIDVLIIDDGSTDKTFETAQKFKVNHIIRNKTNRGLGYTFKRGLKFALKKRYDILVNTDGDNQYPGKYIPDLVKPIVQRKAEVVIADRQVKKISHFSQIKKFLQVIGSKIVSRAAGIKIPDATSGFRAYSRQALLEINPTSNFSYVIDTLIQVGKKGLKASFIKIKVNRPTRRSRLAKNTLIHLRQSVVNILMVYLLYEPLKVFSILASIFIIIGLVPLIRFLIFYFEGNGSGHVQSLILGVLLCLTGVQFFGIALVGKILAKHRQLSEDVLYYLKSGRDD
ncbi:glycosyl transferase [Candidatus Beckwithbacteria bacterium CG10_big_fil_rev_8_21_14_0_10_34_10]|uniref:Glycosyl transferase n=1 Tax=Candidatus Beckwithbacteria bacterium CG10_big_fil_rev_8_21_14_0_10_34_10 TaxID=1974495 RepID=A0A2H0WBQ1_9BACT|nr:MAG: glycosyl transferase [Candidatus Beckwithbacteria bacterium CG10_big_fil_rev_8_21_14_0_10_34_10]